MKQAWLILLSILFYCSPVYPLVIDSLELEETGIPMTDHLEKVDNLSFETIVENSLEIPVLLKKYEKIAWEYKRPDIVAGIYANLSLAYYYNGKYDENLLYGLKAIRLYDSLNYRIKLGALYGELGYQMKRRNLQKAFILMQKGISVLVREGEPAPLAKIYDNYGVLHEMNKEFDSANYFYQKALAIKIGLGDTIIGVPFSLNNLFALYMLKDKSDSALSFLNKSTGIRLRHNDIFGLAENYSYYGQYYTSNKDYRSAIVWYQKALNIALQHNYTFLIKELCHSLANSYEKTSDYRKALTYQKLYIQYQDSLVNLETNKVIAGLQVEFETAEKEKELLKQQQELVRQKSLRIYSIAGFLFLLILVTVFYIFRMQITKRNEKIRIRNALLEGEESERNRIALELHDSVANDLNGVIMCLDQQTQGNKQIEAGLEKLKVTHMTVRQLSHTLMPWSLKKQGLKAAVEELQAEGQRIGLQIRVQTNGLEQRIDPSIEFNCYRIVQEALGNIIKHAQAQHVLIDLSKIDHYLLVCIEDDGQGFLIENTVNRGIGMQSMKNRTKLINGTFHLASHPGEGTTINIEIPIP